MGGNLMKKNNLFQFGPKKPDFKKKGKKELQRKRRREGVTDEEAMAFGETTEEEMEDKTSAPVRYDICSKLWVYTPKSRKGLPKKLSHDYHGPYRIVAKLSPVHFKLRTVNNHLVFVPMHANRLKPFYDPAHRPIEFPTEAASLPYLIDSALPPDSFTVDPPASTPAADSPDLIVPDSNDEPAISRPEDFHRPLEIRAV
eukprot:gene16329-17967_t